METSSTSRHRLNSSSSGLPTCAPLPTAPPPATFIHPVIRAITLHFWLAYDHPFVDDNVRAAWRLFYWAMLRNGYWLFSSISISTILRTAPRQYADAFRKTETAEHGQCGYRAAPTAVFPPDRRGYWPSRYDHRVLPSADRYGH